MRLHRPASLNYITSLTLVWCKGPLFSGDKIYIRYDQEFKLLNILETVKITCLLDGVTSNIVTNISNISTHFNTFFIIQNLDLINIFRYSFFSRALYKSFYVCQLCGFIIVLVLTWVNYLISLCCESIHTTAITLLPLNGILKLQMILFCFFPSLSLSSTSFIFK